MAKRRYSEMVYWSTIKERFDYLRLDGRVGQDTFAHDRWLNQRFYGSPQWRAVRNHVIARDEGCDLGVLDFPINDRVYIHHMNPIQVADLTEFNPEILDPEFLISCTHQTHNAIHYGDEKLLPKPFVPRRPGDTQLW